MKNLFALKNRYRFVAFSTGFVLMAYELAGARILSPVVGSSTYVWTSIIGVIIAALSAGYFFGGTLADKRQKQQDIVILLAASAFGILSTLLLSDVVLQAIAQSRADIRLQALVASLVLFAPTSLVLGAISPYLAKVHTASFEETGRSIATLSALNSLGGIVGTFSVGFLFFGFMGSRQTLIVLVGIIALSSALLTSKRNVHLNLRIFTLLAAATLLIFLGNQPAAEVVAQPETATSSYQVKDIAYNNRPVRVLTMGPGGYQSGVFLDGDKSLVFGYTTKIAQAVAELPRKNNILILGGGTFTMPEYFALTYPNSHIDVVEIDPELTHVATEYFSYSNPKNVRIYAEDARTYINRTNTKYDAIIIDAFSDTGIPFSITTDEFAQKITTQLTANGAVLMNVIAGSNPQCAPLLHGIFSSFSAYMNGSVIPVYDDSLNARQNLILAFTKENNNWLHSLRGKSLHLPTTPKLTDNFAPIERLHQRCLNS